MNIRIPFWPYSLTPCECKAVSNVPPIECMELAVEPLRGWYLLLEPDLPTISIPSWGAPLGTDLGNGYSLREGVGDVGDKLSTEGRRVDEDIMWKPQIEELPWAIRPFLSSNLPSNAGRTAGP